MDKRWCGMARRWPGRALVIGALLVALALVPLAGLETAASERSNGGLVWSLGPEVQVLPGIFQRVVEANRESGGAGRNDNDLGAGEATNGGPGVPLRGVVLRVDLQEDLTDIRLVPGGNLLGERTSLSALAKQYGAVAAVNGGFFDMQTGHPTGNLVLDGRLLATADSKRSHLAVFGDGRLDFALFQSQMLIGSQGETYRVDRVNRPTPAPDGITLYTPEWGPIVPTFNGYALFVRRDGGGDVVTGRAALVALIPEDGYVLVFNGRSAFRAYDFLPGSRLKLRLEPGADGLRYLVEGGPLLVEDGRPLPGRAAAEGLGAIQGPNPRTAAGVTATGHLLLVVVDGRQPDWSVGVSFEELAGLMMDLGAVRAVALDGGGSSTMWLTGQVINRPAGGTERRLANAILILHGVAVFLNGEQLFFDVPAWIDPRARTMVPMRGIFEAVGAQVEWEPSAKRVTASRGDRTVSLVIGDPTAYVDGQPYRLDVPAAIHRERTMVPLRFVSESLGVGVHWEADPPRVYLRME